MNAQLQENGLQATPPVKAKKDPTPVEKVTMTDGRVVDFVGNYDAATGKGRKMLKDVLVAGVPIDEVDSTTLEAATIGDLAIRLDFRNGTTRTYPLNPKLGLRYAGHGGLQKYGDELAGQDSDDLDDWALVTDRLHERLSAGDWTKEREGDSMAGTSVLIKAMIEFAVTQGKERTLDQIRAFLKDKSQKEKLALRGSKSLKPIVDRLEAEKVAKLSEKYDSEAALAAL